MAPTEVVTKDIEYLARQLVEQKSKYIFWLGAGVSLTAGIPMASGVVDRLLDRLWRQTAGSQRDGKTPDDYHSLSKSGRVERAAVVREWGIESLSEVENWWRANGKPQVRAEESDWGGFYSSCLGLLPGEEDRQEFIVECIKEGRGRLNVAHLLMSQLMVNGLARIVLTTNFDDLLLRALHLFFEVPAAVDPDSLTSLMTSSSFLQVAYLHGRLSSYRQRHTHREIHESMPDLEGFLATSLKDHGLVIVGYRGGDEAPMAILSEVLKQRRAGPGRGLFWVSYESDFDNLADGVKEILQFKDTYWLKGWDADNFFEKLCASHGIGLGLPDPAKFAERLEEILPEKARPSWKTLRGSQLASDAPPLNQGQEERPARVEGVAEAFQSEQTPGSPAARWETESPEETLTMAEAAASINPEDSEAFFRWGHSLSKLSRDEEALEKYQRAAEIYPSAIVFSAWGDSLLTLGRDEEAAEKYRHAIELDPALESAIFGLGRSLQNLERLEEAAETFRRAAALNPANAQALGLWGAALHQLGRDEQAITKFRQAIEIDPQYAGALGAWGYSLNKLGRNDEALEKYRQATEINPLNAWAFAHWGDSLYELGRFEEAIDKFRLATEVHPTYAWAFAKWGQSLKALNRLEEALGKLREATEVAPSYAWPYILWGDALQDLGRHEEAIEKFRRATELDPESSWTFAVWGISLQRLGRHEEAIEKFRKATETNPASAWSFTLWGNSLAELGRTEEAAEKYRLATTLDPTDSYAYSRWGRLLHNLGRFDEAIEKYRRAVQPNSNYAWAYSLWGDALKALGRVEEAEEKYRKNRELISGRG